MNNRGFYKSQLVILLLPCKKLMRSNTCFLRRNRYFLAKIMMTQVLKSALQRVILIKKPTKYWKVNNAI